MTRNLPTRSYRAIETALSQTAAKLDEIKAQLELARGTGDVTEAARAAVAGSLTERVEALLRAGIWSLDDLRRELNQPAGPVGKVLKRAREARQIYNVGTEDRPRWTWIVSDAVETQVLYAQVERLISERPFEFAELLDATGARRGRISGAIVALQHGGRKVLNLGTDKRARWFLLPGRGAR